MSCCRNNCTLAAVIIGIIAGVVLGVLYALGFVATGVIFWALLLFGMLGLLAAPLYAGNARGEERCFCSLRPLYLASVLGEIISAIVGLIVAPIAPVAVTAVVVGVAVLFTVMQIVTLVCLTNCLCGE